MKIRNQLSMTLAFGLLMAFQLPAPAATTSTIPQRTERILLGIHWIHGLANEQSVRATVANLVPAGANGNNVVTIEASLSIYDEHGTVVAQTERTQIRPGKFHSFDIHRIAIGSRGDERTGRAEVFDELKVFASGLDDAEAEAVRERAAEFIPVSFELVNDTGETSVADIVDGASNTLLVGERPPSSTGGSGVAFGDGSVRFLSHSVGIVSGQSLLFSARNLSGDPIGLRVKVYDKNGDVIAVSPEVEIPPGEFRTVRFNHDDLVMPEEPGTSRKEVRMDPFFNFKASRLSRVLASLEVVDTRTGRTLVGDGSVRFVSSGVNPSLP